MSLSVVMVEVLNFFMNSHAVSSFHEYEKIRFIVIFHSNVVSVIHLVVCIFRNCRCLTSTVKTRRCGKVRRSTCRLVSILTILRRSNLSAKRPLSGTIQLDTFCTRHKLMVISAIDFLQTALITTYSYRPGTYRCYVFLVHVEQPS